MADLGHGVDYFFVRVCACEYVAGCLLSLDAHALARRRGVTLAAVGGQSWGVDAIKSRRPVSRHIVMNGHRSHVGVGYVVTFQGSPLPCGHGASGELQALVERAPDDLRFTRGACAALTPPLSLAKIINRVRGKTKVQRVRDRVRESKANKKAQGKVPHKHKVSEDTPMTRRDGSKKLGAMSKKSIRKREKRAKNVRCDHSHAHTLQQRVS